MVRYVPNSGETRRVAAAKGRQQVNLVLNETLALSRRYVPVRSPRPGDRRATGRLAASLRKNGPRVLTTRVTGSVGSTLPYAAAVHEGAAAHPIIARRRPLLSFWWERRGVQFYGRRVRHPGVRRQSRTQYLWLPLTIVARRRNFVTRRLAPGILSPLADV